jgi:hypothetical protein
MHKDGKICFAQAAEEELTDEEMIGILAHEFGHVLAATLKFPGHCRGVDREAEEEADWLVRNVFGLPLEYNERTLQQIPISALKR